MEFKRALAAATALLALLLIYSFAFTQPIEELEPTPSPTMKAELLSTQKIGGAVLETYSLEGNYTASITAPYTMSLFTVLPADAEFKQTSSRPPSNPSPITENAFSDDVPAGSPFNRSVSLADGGAPLFLAGNESQGNDWERVLRKASALELNASEAIALQKKLNEALSIATVFGNYSVLEELVDYAKNVTETKITNPDYDAADAISKRKIDASQSDEQKTDYKEYLSKLFEEQIPDEIVFSVSEDSPQDYDHINVNLPASGNLLFKKTLTGTGKNYFVAELTEFYDDRLTLHVGANIDAAKLNDEGLVDFDEKQATLTIDLGSTFLVDSFKKEVSLKLVVKHREPAVEEGEPAGFEELPDEYPAGSDACITPPPGSVYGIVVDKNEDEGSRDQRIYVFKNGELLDGWPRPVSTGIKTGEVSVGDTTDHRTPTGTFYVTKDVSVASKPNADDFGPLHRFMCIDLRGRISSTNPGCLIGIHGTPFADSAIGVPNSLGCIMMRNDDFAELREMLLKDEALSTKQTKIKICP
jgi:hypothetical protein